MECPVCHKKNHNEIDLHSDGYAKDLMECGDCGALWIMKRSLEVLVSNSTTGHTNEGFSPALTPL